MLMHRLGTFMHIMATTELNWFQKRKSESDDVKYLIELSREMGRLQGCNRDSVASRASSVNTNMGEFDGDDEKTEVKHRKNILKNINKQANMNNRAAGAGLLTVNQAFKKRFDDLMPLDDVGDDGDIQRKRENVLGGRMGTRRFQGPSK